MTFPDNFMSYYTLKYYAEIDFDQSEHATLHGSVSDDEEEVPKDKDASWQFLVHGGTIPLFTVERVDPSGAPFFPWRKPDSRCKTTDIMLQ